MTDKKNIIVPAGTRIIIELNSVSRNPLSFAPRPSSLGKGIIKTRRPNDYLPRRKKRTNGFIQFYDLGQFVSEESWQDLDFKVMPDMNLEFNNPSFGRDLELSDYQSLDDLITETPLADFETHFRKIEKTPGVDFQFGVFGSDFSYSFGDIVDTKWTTAGLELSDAELADSQLSFDCGYPIFQSFILTGDSKNKITSVYDAGSDAVAFTPGETDKYFLVPALLATYGAAETTDLTTGFDVNYYLNYFYRLFPRAGFAAGQFGSGSAVYTRFPVTNTLFYYNDAYTQSLIHRAFPGARAKKFTFTGFGVGDYSDYDAADFPPADVFPTPPAMPDTSEAIRLNANFIQQDAPEGSLLAIIKQGENWFYVWK